MNLLDLPVVVLEEIVASCTVGWVGQTGDWKMATLMECNKFLKEFIESSPRLRDLLELSVSLSDHPDVVGRTIEQNRDVLKACLASKRKYSRIDLYIDNLSKFCAIEDPDVNFKTLFDKLAPEVTTVCFHVASPDCDLNFLIKLVNFVEKMKNIVNLTMSTYQSSSNANNQEDPTIDFTFADNNFEKLKYLCIESNLIGTSLLRLFQNCRKIEQFSLDIKFQIDSTIVLKILENNRNTLYELDLKYSTNPIVILKGLKTADINLTTFNFAAVEIKGETLDLFTDFVTSQRRLAELSIQADIDETFLKKVNGAVYSLKELSLDLRCSVIDFYEWGAFKITNLESLHVRLNADFEANNITDNLLKLPNKKLNDLLMRGLDFGGNIFERMLKNYDALIKLSVVFCTNYHSDDIFKIFKHLKKLEELLFHFPPNSPIDSSLFYTNEDLVLPKIKKITFKVNEYISSGVISNLSKSIQNVSTITIIPIRANRQDLKIDMDVIVNREYNITLDYLTRKCHNLKEICYCGVTLEESFLQHIASNLRNFNKNPEKFKFNRRTIVELKADIEKKTN